MTPTTSSQPQWLKLLRRLLASASTLPTHNQWLMTLAIISGSSAISLPFGLATGFLRPSWVSPGLGQLVLVCSRAFIFPALLEEALFRAAFLPHPAVDPPDALALPAFTRASLGPLTAFVAYHLVHPLAAHRLVFYDWRFLTFAAVLGASCTLTHRFTRGSLVAAALAHWLPVCVWVLALGGAEKLGSSL